MRSSIAATQNISHFSSPPQIITITVPAAAIVLPFTYITNEKTIASRIVFDELQDAWHYRQSEQHRAAVEIEYRQYYYL